MEKQYFWYSSGAESIGAIPTGAKAGQFLVLSAQAPVDLETGRMIRDLVDLPAEAADMTTVRTRATGRRQHLINAYFGPVMAQTWIIYQNLSKILAMHGATLKDVVRQRIYVCDIRDVGWMERVMLPFFPEEKPTTLILGVPSHGLHEDIRVWVDAIALIPQKDGLQKEAIYLPELEKVTRPYPQAVKVGQFLFFEGLIGVDPHTGDPVTKFSELGPEARSGVQGRYVDAISEAMKCQWWLIHEGHLGRLLESQGATLLDLLDLTGHWRHGMRESGEREYIRENMFKTQQPAPAMTGFGIYNLSVIPSVETVQGGIALLPGEYHKQSLKCGEADTASVYAGMTKAGAFWFTAGMVGMDWAKRQNIASFADLSDNGRFFAQNYINSDQDTMAQAWYIYNYMLDNVDAKPSEVLHQTVYMKDLREWPAVERIANTVFQGHIPPTTVVPVDEVAFDCEHHMPMPIRGARLEIQLCGMTE